MPHKPKESEMEEKTLRDEFAMAALPVCLEDAMGGSRNFEAAIRLAFKLADDVMKARETNEKE
jgi:hypothetical protein